MRHLTMLELHRSLSLVSVLTCSLVTSALAQQAPAAVNSGFDPAVGSFGFENYGGDAGYKNLSEVEMVRLFGEGVCSSVQSGVCTLSPVAQQWMNETNTSMNGGHCEGMAVLSALFYTGKVNLADFGPGVVKDLQIKDNEKLQREIAFWWATQSTSPTNSGVIKGTPKEILARLSEVLKAGKDAADTDSIGIYKRDGSDGHAVTPYSVEEKGDGVWNIMVYDNNYPGEGRAIEVNTTADTWSYSASINPGVPAALYEGDASTKSLDLTPSTLRLGKQDCPFCAPSATTAASGGTTLKGAAPAAARYNELFVEGKGVHVLITDAQGHRLGLVGGSMVNEIPGASASFSKGKDEPWTKDEDPVFRVPTGVRFTVTVDGSALTKDTVAQVAMIGPGYSLDVQDIKLKPKQKDTLKVSPDGKALSYTPGQGESPDLVLSVEGKSVDHEFVVKGFDLEEGGSVNLNLDVDKGQLQLSTVGNKKPGTYEMTIVRYDDKGTQEFGGTFQLEPADTVFADYLKWQGNGKPLEVKFDYKSDGTIDETVELEDLQK